MPHNTAPGSIYSRNKDNTLEAQSILWRALCDSPKAIRKHMTEDAVFASPDTNKLYSPDTSPTFLEHIDDDWEPFTAFKIHEDPEFIEIDMMSSALTYRVTAWRQQQGGQMIPIEVMCSSVWRQLAGGEWKCCMHQITRIQI